MGVGLINTTLFHLWWSEARIRPKKDELGPACASPKSASLKEELHFHFLFIWDFFSKGGFHILHAVPFGELKCFHNFQRDYSECILGGVQGAKNDNKSIQMCSEAGMTGPHLWRAAMEPTGRGMSVCVPGQHLTPSNKYNSEQLRRQAHVRNFFSLTGCSHIPAVMNAQARKPAEETHTRNI